MASFKTTDRFLINKTEKFNKLAQNSPSVGVPSSKENGNAPRPQQSADPPPRADVGGSVRALLGSPTAQTSTPLHLRTHAGGAPGLPGRRPPQPFLLNGKGLSGGPVKSWGGLLEPEAL